MKKSNGERTYAILESGKTYKFAGYSWTACEVNNDRHVAVIQSCGVTHGAWPGFKMTEFDSKYSIDGYDISAYDVKTKKLYDAIKDVEDKSAFYGKGLYLVSKEKAGFTRCGEPGSGNYWKALKAAAENASSFGSPSNCAWLGTVNGGSYAWYVYSDGNVYDNNGPYGDIVVAPAFNLDLSKVEVAGDEIIIKGSDNNDQPENVYCGSNQTNGFVVAPAFNLDLSKVKIVGGEIVIRKPVKSVKNARNTKKEKIREFLDEIYKESEILPENFGDEIVAELEERFLEDGYEITKKNAIEEMLWCYMCKMQ